MDELKYKIFESDINFNTSSTYEIVEKFIKPYVIKLRRAKQEHNITESYIKGDVPQYIIELVEKLSKVKIIPILQ